MMIVEITRHCSVALHVSSRLGRKFPYLMHPNHVTLLQEAPDLQHMRIRGAYFTFV